MQTCSYCGTPSNKAALFCAQCGQSLTVEAPDKNDKYFLALERHEKRQRTRHINREGSNESLSLYIGVIAVVACLHGLSLVLHSNFNLMGGNIGLLLVAVALLAAVIRSVHDQRLGFSRIRSYTETFLIGIVTYGMIIGIFWYFGNEMQNPHLFDNFLKLPTPTPKTK